MTARQVAKPKISDANANEIFDVITNGFEHTANLAIDSLSQDNAQADGRVVLFFYFEDADTGLLMLIPGIRGWRGTQSSLSTSLVGPIATSLPSWIIIVRCAMRRA
jgi:hypothetical protein